MKTRIPLRFLHICCALAVFFATSGAAHAIRYTGNADGKWSNPKNWDPEQVPGPGDSAEIVDGSDSVVLDIDVTVANLTTAVDVRVSNCCDGVSRLTVTNRFDLKGGSVGSGGGPFGSGTLIVNIPAGGTLAISGTDSFRKRLSGTVNNAGRIEWSGESVNASGLILNNNGLFEIFTDSAFLGTGVINNNENGLIIKQTGGGVTHLAGSDADQTINNKGVIAVASGTLAMGKGTSTGEFKVGHGKNLFFRDAHTFNDPARFTAVADPVFGDGPGPAIVTLANRMTFSGRINTSADLELGIGTGFSGGSGTINFGGGEATLEGEGRLIWKEGAIYGTFTFAEGFRTILTGAFQKAIGDGSVVTNRGTMDWFGPGPFGISRDTTFFNRGIFNVRAAGIFLPNIGSSTPIFDNIGTLNTFPDGTSEAYARLRNTGVVNIGGFGYAGILKVGAGYEQRAEGTLYMEVGGTNAATPQFDQLLGSATIAGGLSVDIINDFVPAKDARFTLVSSQTGTFSDLSIPGDAARFRIEYPGNSRTDLVSLSDGPVPQKNTAVNGVLGPTTLTVNHSPNPANSTSLRNRAWGVSSPAGAELDAFLEFVALQLSQVPGIEVQVQHSTLPNDPTSWFALENGNKGKLARDPNTGNFIVKSSHFPRIPNVYFRAKVSAPGYPENYSNTVGPFDLRQKPETLEPTVFRMYGEDQPSSVLPGQKLRFTASQSSQATGLYLRVQHTKSPLVESSWTDLSSGTLTLGTNYYALETTNYPSGSEIYFRVISAAPGKIDSISNYIGPWKLTPNDLPAVQINLAENQAFSRNSAVPINVTASDSNGISRVELYVDGENHSVDTAAPYQFDLRGLEAGTHSLIAIAYDNLFTPNFSNIIERIRLTDEIRTIYNRTADGAWNDASKWTPQSVPGVNDIVEINNGRSVTLNGSVSVRGLYLAGKVAGPGTLTVINDFSWISGQLDSLTLKISSSGRFLSFSDADHSLKNVTINNEGKMVITGKGVIGNAGTTLNNKGTFTFAGELGQTFKGTVPVAAFGTLNHNGGLLRVAGGKLVAPRLTQNGGELKLGTFIGNDGNTILSDAGVGLIGNDGNTLIGNDGNTLIGNDGNTLAALAGAGIVTDNGAGLISDNGAAFNLNDGSVTGYGRVGHANFKQNGGAFQPGSSPGAVDITGNYTQGANAKLILEIGGHDGLVGNYDMIAVKGTAHFAGDLIVKSLNGYQSAGFGAVPIGYGAFTGKFKTVTANGQVTLGSKGALVKVDGANPPAPKALNIATRMKVETGDNALIAGFIITGDAPKKVIIRGIGPSLPFAGALADPTLSLDNGAVTNDNWRSNQEQEIIATTIPPSNNLEAAIVATLNPGPHTAVLRGSGNATGIGVVEVYDLDSGSPVQLANIASRGFVQAGDDVMIGGFIIGGAYPAKVIVRAIGPSLPFSGKLEDPTLELVDQNGGSISNDNWRSSQEAEIIATTIPPTNDKEAAIVATLAPGNYTAIVRGKDDTTGIAVVEAYNLQ